MLARIAYMIAQDNSKNFLQLKVKSIANFFFENNKHIFKFIKPVQLNSSQCQVRMGNMCGNKSICINSGLTLSKFEISSSSSVCTRIITISCLAEPDRKSMPSAKVNIRNASHQCIQPDLLLRNLAIRYL